MRDRLDIVTRLKTWRNYFLAIFLVIISLSMVSFTINFQAEPTNFNLKLFYLGHFQSPDRGPRLLIDQNALDSMAMSPNRENVSIIENYPQL